MASGRWSVIGRSLLVLVRLPGCREWIFSIAYAQLYDLFRSMTPARLTAGLLLVLVGVSVGYLFVHPAAQPQVDLMDGRPISASQLAAIKGGRWGRRT